MKKNCTLEGTTKTINDFKLSIWPESEKKGRPQKQPNTQKVKIEAGGGRRAP
jgi:hypothetical protein